jgi:tRNA threonylcarbamoyladenosine biosynthesis protein TsaB
MDTATESLSLCLRAESGILELNLRMGFRHAETLACWIEKLCRAGEVTPKNLDLVAVGIGPGSFTGLRIGMATAKGLAKGAGCAIVGVPTLEALAWRFKSMASPVLVVIDARKGRLYAALHRGGDVLFGPLDISADDLIDRLTSIEGLSEHTPLLLTGPFAGEFGRSVGRRSSRVSFVVDPRYNTVDARAVLECGLEIFRNSGSQEKSLVPLYLRKSEAEAKRVGKDK